jgi:hypothetical protein
MKYAPWLSVALWVISCFLPALATNPERPMTGAELLLWGIIGLVLFVPCWLANPLWIASMLPLTKTNRACCACLALAFALVMFVLPGRDFHSTSFFG